MLLAHQQRDQISELKCQVREQPAVVAQPDHGTHQPGAGRKIRRRRGRHAHLPPHVPLEPRVAARGDYAFFPGSREQRVRHGEELDNVAEARERAAARASQVLGIVPKETRRSCASARRWEAPRVLGQRPGKIWWSGGGSNSRPSHCERDALPAELPPRRAGILPYYDLPMQIAPPFGYSEIVPFLKNQKVRLPAAGELPRFVQQGNAIPVSLTEFRAAAHEYPIVFASGDGGKTFASVAVLGMAAGENLYVSEGAWARDKYLPAYARRYPFCMARVTLNKVAQKDRLICVEKAFVGEGGEALFDAEGKPQERWKAIERLLTEYEADLERSREMCAILADHGLLEPF